MSTQITITRNPGPDTLAELGVEAWPIWSKEASSFPWHYDDEEVCYLLAGRVTVTPEGGEAVSFGAGDLVTFPAGMSCHWQISEDVRKHYCFR